MLAVKRFWSRIVRCAYPIWQKQNAVKTTASSLNAAFGALDVVFINFNLAAAKLKQFGHSAKEFEYLVKGFRTYRIPFYKVF